MVINDLLDAIVTTIHAELPGLSTVETHPGQFTLEELEHFMVSTPAVRVALLGIERSVPVSDGQRDATLVLTAFVVTTDAHLLSRDRAANNIVEALVNLIPQNKWGVTECVFGAGEAKGHNLYSADIREKGVTIFAIRWEQTVRLGTDFWDQPGVLPTELYVGIAPDVGPGHEADYTLIGDP